VSGYRIHHGRVRATAASAQVWIAAADGTPLGWRTDRVLSTTLHGLLENDEVRRALISWIAELAGMPAPTNWAASFARAREARFDQIADTLEAHLDVERVLDLIASGDSSPAGTSRRTPPVRSLR
jgi:adenosylcobyric acid synthase